MLLCILAMTTKPKRHQDLRAACVEEAALIIEQKGVDNLSLREVARRLGVSHQAPYKHFESRDHILAEVVSQAFIGFAEFLDQDTHPQSAHDALDHLGQAYMRFADEHPTQYQLIFGTALPDPAQHPGMMENATRAFALLQARLRHWADELGTDPSDATVSLNALFIWSLLHGVASLSRTRALETVDLPPEVKETARGFIMSKIGDAVISSFDPPVPQVTNNDM